MRMKIAIKALPIFFSFGSKYKPRAIITRGVVGKPIRDRKLIPISGTACPLILTTKAISIAHSGGKRKNLIH